jgi:hypothetical protein
MVDNENENILIILYNMIPSQEELTEEIKEKINILLSKSYDATRYTAQSIIRFRRLYIRRYINL